MQIEELPYRAKPEILHRICKLTRARDIVTKGEVYDNIEENEKTIRRTLAYAVQLGFLEQDGEAFELTSRGAGISYANSFSGNEAVIESFREAIAEFQPYREALMRTYLEDQQTTIKDIPAIPQSVLKRNLSISTDNDVEDREVNVLIKTAEAASLGEYRAGRRGYETRLVISDGYGEYLDELVEQYDLPKEERNSQLSDESVTGDENTVEQSKEEAEDLVDVDISSNQLQLSLEIPLQNKSPNEVAEIVKQIQDIV